VSRLSCDWLRTDSLRTASPLRRDIKQIYDDRGVFRFIDPYSESSIGITQAENSMMWLS
jgi:hypothetical protein